jgi:hypothetical protein
MAILFRGYSEEEQQRPLPQVQQQGAGQEEGGRDQQGQQERLPPMMPYINKYQCCGAGPGGAVTFFLNRS